MVGIDFFGGGGESKKESLMVLVGGLWFDRLKEIPYKCLKASRNGSAPPQKQPTKRLNGVLYLSFFRKPYAVTLNQTVSVSNDRVRRCCRCDERFLTATASLCLVYVWGVCDKRQLPFSVQQ